MPPASRLGKQIAEVAATLSAAGVRFALIGGLALASHKVVRATQDVDLLADAVKADEIEVELLKLGYRCLHRSADAANYVRGDERVDFLYAHRPIACRLLADAVELQTPLGDLRVVSAEGLIGFKLQGLVNDPRRTQDLEDIRALLRANRATLDIEQVREMRIVSFIDQPEVIKKILQHLGLWEESEAPPECPVFSQ
jgi:predicted nucleotidyltransferase